MTLITKVPMIAPLLFIAIMPAVGVSEKTDIRVRLINALSGKPFVGRDQQLFGTNARSGPPHGDIVFHLQAKTGPDGIAHFLIGAPLPYRLIPTSAQTGGCAWHGAPPIVTEDVLQSGWVGPNTCARKNQSFHWQDVKAEPGEIILFVVEPRGP